MDLSKLKWPLIILVVAGVGWLLSSPGVNYMFGKYKATAENPDSTAEQHERAEAGLTRLGGYLLKTFQYGKAKDVFEFAVTAYPEGENSYYNFYRLVKCYEKAERYQDAANLLNDLMVWNSSEHDPRVPINNNLKLRREKLVEVHGLNT